MNYDEVIAEIRRLESCGIIADPSIVVYGKTDAANIYTVRIVGYAENGAIVPR